jgi:hypothetical protein
MVGDVNLQNKAKRNMMKTIAMPTGWLLDPLGRYGVCVSTVAAISMQMPIPIPPTMNRNLRPNRSTVQVALSVNKILKVAFRALISATVSELVKTFW